MELDLSGIRFLFISKDIVFLRTKKNELKNNYNAEVLVSNDFEQGASILETENPQVVVCLFTNKQETLSFIRIFQKLIPQGILYFYFEDDTRADILSTPEFIFYKNKIGFLTTPIQWEKVFAKIHQKLSYRLTGVANLTPEIKQLQYFLLFRSHKMQRGLKFLPKMASTEYSVLITGETGTGKEMVARAIHSLSSRKNKPFVAINCGAIPENLVESELFGYEKGAFTGATATKKGKFELANKGTLLLDEIGDMPLSLQTKLLRILEDGQVFRIGSEKCFSVDVRVLAATNVNLQQKIEEKLFREDLFYRLNILRINIPPLRARKEDISLLGWHFLQRALSEINYLAPYPYLTADGVVALQEYDWYGNVRELKNFMTQLAVLLPSQTRKIDGEMVSEALAQFSSSFKNTSENITQNTTEYFQTPLNKSLAQVQNLYIDKVLELHNNNKTKAANSLGISLRSLRQKQNS